jgi:hypothetical protein
MNAADVLKLIAGLLGDLTGLLAQALAAQAAGDQATLDLIHRQVVASSDALAPPGAVVVEVRS